MQSEEPEKRMGGRIARLEAENARLSHLTSMLDQSQTIVINLHGTILFWDSEATSLYGWSSVEAIGRVSHELLLTEFPQPLADIHAELLAHGRWRGELRQRHRDGSSICVASTWSLRYDAEGAPASIAKVNTEITDLRRTTDALQILEATARSLLENSNQGILSTDQNGRITEANAMVQLLFGYSRAELIGAAVEMLVPERFRDVHIDYRASYKLNHATSGAVGRELVARRKDGSEFPAEISLGYVSGPWGDERYFAYISDITARRQAETEREELIHGIKQSLAEKTVLLKEVHHRVKNNLAVIAGLLGMQGDALQDKRLSEPFVESQQRVLSMALVHEYLYANEHLDRVNFGEYLRQLAGQLCISYAAEPALVDVQIEADEIDLAVHRARPCGLIVNELLSNALKYDFPNGVKGSIRIRFAQLEQDQLLLSCQDNGIGIPEDFDWQNPKSLGLRIVRILTKQIDGFMTLDRSKGGTWFDLRFPPHGTAPAH